MTGAAFGTLPGALAGYVVARLLKRYVGKVGPRGRAACAVAAGGLLGALLAYLGALRPMLEFAFPVLM